MHTTKHRYGPLNLILIAACVHKRSEEEEEEEIEKSKLCFYLLV